MYFVDFSVAGFEVARHVPAAMSSFIHILIAPSLQNAIAQHQKLLLSVTPVPLSHMDMQQCQRMYKSLNLGQKKRLCLFPCFCMLIISITCFTCFVKSLFLCQP